MEKLLKDALEMSKTKLDSYPDCPNSMRSYYERDYHSTSHTIKKILNALDVEYKVCIAKRNLTHRYLMLMDDFEKYNKRLKAVYQKWKAEPKESDWHKTKVKVQKAYEDFPEAYEFLRNQMAIAKFSEDEKFKNYLYRNYVIAKPKNGERYFAYPNLKMSWHGVQDSMPKNFWNVEAETLYEMKHEIDTIVMTIFAKVSGLKSDFGITITFC